jgi:hypothetical protein
MTTAAAYDAAIKAAYAGHKYHLAVQAAIDMFQQGHVDTPGNEDLVSRYYREWQALAKEAIRLHEEAT